LKDTSETLEALSPVEIFGFATRGRAKRSYNEPYTRHKTLAGARAHLAIHGGSMIYEFDFDKNEWVEIGK